MPPWEQNLSVAPLRRHGCPGKQPQPTGRCCSSLAEAEPLECWRMGRVSRTRGGESGRLRPVDVEPHPNGSGSTGLPSRSGPFADVSSPWTTAGWLHSTARSAAPHGRAKARSGQAPSSRPTAVDRQQCVVGFRLLRVVV